MHIRTYQLVLMFAFSFMLIKGLKLLTLNKTEIKKNQTEELHLHEMPVHLPISTLYVSSAAEEKPGPYICFFNH
ncbi:MAG: hypothetical protein EKK37_08130 [Sphingobacteriales bacterium]|nr:MAG: hypothetical protein EKK37_08130 [Sphingobacteriales bacterium]